MSNHKEDKYNWGLINKFTGKLYDRVFDTREEAEKELRKEYLFGNWRVARLSVREITNW